MIRELLGRLSRSKSPEVNSGVPVESATGIKPLTMAEMVQRYVRTELSRVADQDGDETFEEADDFEEEDPEILPMTHHQVLAMSEDELRGVAADYGVDLVDRTSQEAPGGAISPPPGTVGTPQTAVVPPSAAGSSGG